MNVARRLGCFFSSLALAASLMPPASAHASPEGDAVEISVDTSELGPGFEDLSRRIFEVTQAATNMLDKAPSDVQVRVRWLDPDAFRYQVSVTASVAGGEPVTKARECDGCTVDRLVEEAVAALKEVSSQLQEPTAAPPQPTADPTPPPTPTPSTAVTSGSPSAVLEADTPKRARLGALGWSGVTLLTLGVAATAPGIAFLVVKEGPVAGQPTKLRNYQTAGIALTAAGGVSVLVGAILLAVDRPRSRKLSATPVVSPSLSGLSLSGRF